MFLRRYSALLIISILSLISVSAMADSADQAQDIRDIISILEDDARRDALILNLKSSLEAESTSSPPPTQSPDITSVELLLAEAGKRIDIVGQVMTALNNAASQIPRVGQWLKWQTESEGARAAWIATIIIIVPVLVLGALIAIFIDRKLRPLHRREDHDNGQAATLQLVINLALDCIPLLVFGLIAEAILYFEQPPDGLAAITRTLVLAIVSHEIIKAITRYVMGQDGHRALLPLKRRIADPVAAGIRRASGVGLYGSAIYSIASIMGLPWEGLGALRHLVGLIVVVIIAITILRVRKVIIRRKTGTGRWHATTQFVFRYGAWFALVYLALVYVVWALSIPDGFYFLLTRGLGSLLLLLLLRVCFTRLNIPKESTSDPVDIPDSAELLDSSLEDQPDLASEVDQRTFRHFLKGLALVICLWMIAELWGLEITRWMLSSEGANVSRSLMNILIIIAGFFGLVTVSRWISQAFANSDERQVSNRQQTIAVIGHNMVRVMAWVTAAIMILTELGVNVAPLLAGAGVIGLAIGFGAQRLVQDIITGFFILVEDTLSVGDVVDLGGQSGVVEALTIRSVRLRDYAGNVHTLPFSSIDSVTNKTKDYSYAVFELGIDYEADIDRAIDQMERVARKLRRDVIFRHEITGPFELAGVDTLADSAIMLKARIRVRAGSQWNVVRAYNKAIKQAFDEEGISIPYPHLSVKLMKDDPKNGPDQEVVRHA